LLSIGEFSKICGVTTRALRYYDDIDLIKPKHISSESGYRFYDVSQIRQLLFINRLKGYGFSLEEIENQLLGDIKNLKRGLDIMTFINDFEVHLVETKEQNILYSRQRMSVNDYCKYISNLFSLAYSKGMTIAAAPISIYYDQEFDPTDNDTAVALPVAEVNEHTRSLPGGLCATSVCKGAYSTLPNVYAKLTEWISENGYQVVSAPYEQYIKGPMEAKSADDFITNVYFPVKKI
jgi:DNA-binding transcriptional MerR regulator